MYSRLFHVLAILQTRVLVFIGFSRFILVNSHSRVLVFFTFSLIILANSHSRPKRESTRGRGYELRRISHHSVAPQASGEAHSPSLNTRKSKHAPLASDHPIIKQNEERGGAPHATGSAHSPPSTYSSPA